MSAEETLLHNSLQTGAPQQTNKQKVARQTVSQDPETIPAHQLDYIKMRTTPANLTSSHKFAYRVSFPTLFWGNYYFAAFAGPERRNNERLEREGQSSARSRSIFFMVVMFLLVAFTLFGALCAAYLLKSALNINLFDGESIFHPLFVKGFR